ncbi:MAG: hypothetical protein H0V29_03900 [Thermoleophilaceae bacterium]|nr:hypothetical protein [Thermoleophilaceae bacterium]
MTSSVVIGHDLIELEAVIERGMRSVVEVGRALMAIRDGKKYRDRGYTTFSDYCRERWGFQDSHARLLVRSAKLAGEIEAQTGAMAPVNPRQTRELMRADDPVEVWAEVVEEHEPEEITAAVIRDHVERRREPVGAEAEAEPVDAEPVDAEPVSLPSLQDIAEDTFREAIRLALGFLAEDELVRMVIEECDR